MKTLSTLVLALCPIFMTLACGGSKPNGEGEAGSHCTVSGDCACWDCQCSDPISQTNSAVNGRVCDTSSDSCLGGDDACAVICATGNDTSVSSAAGTDCAAP